MIIKTSLRIAAPRGRDPEQRAQTAAKDIDEEITRLNRIVPEVLDFARPIKFDLAPVGPQRAGGRRARAAARPEAIDGSVLTSTARSLPSVTTDAERLRQALLNILGNAIQAVGAGPRRRRPGRWIDRGSTPAGWRSLVVRQRGPGLRQRTCRASFDPYFTTRRTGTGIGLAISRNIIEGLGGRITVVQRARSRHGGPH